MAETAKECPVYMQKILLFNSIGSRKLATLFSSDFAC